jgi:hypothetical protein
VLYVYRYGKTCTFKHEEDRENYKTKPCRDFERGFCPRGRSCCYIHPGKEGKKKDGSSKSSQEEEGKRDGDNKKEGKRTPCKFFARGVCAQGEECRFAHTVGLFDFFYYHDMLLMAFFLELGSAGHFHENALLFLNVFKDLSITVQLGGRLCNRLQMFFL